MHTHTAQPPTVQTAARTRVRKKPGNDPVLFYAEQVKTGALIAGPHVREACKRHLRDLRQGKSRGIRFDLPTALRAIAFVETFLRLNGGEFEGKPFHLQLWQKFIIGSLFGWLNTDGTRRFRTAYIEIAKGNGKSPMAAAIGFIGLILDQEPRAEIYAAATKKDQAMILFRDAVAMLDQSPDLAVRLVKSGIGERTWNIAYPHLGAWFRPISSDDGQSGPRPHIGLVDEVHEHKTGDVLDMLRRGVKGRRQPLIVEITNSGVDRTSICYAHHEASIAALTAGPDDAGFDDTWFSYICAIDADDDWMADESCWIKANPNMGVSIQPKYLRDAVREARNIPSRQNLIARLNFCIWSDSVSAWIGRDAWMRNERPLQLDDFAGRECTIGLDLSQRLDLTACAFFFPDDQGGGDLLVECWTPEEGLVEREKKDKVPYTQWVREGWLKTTPGASIHYSAIVQRLAAVQQKVQIQHVGFDRWRIAEFQRAMSDDSVELPLQEFGQGFKDMTPAIDQLEHMLANGLLRVQANPVLRWNAASAVVESPTGNEKKFAKRKATGRIDGIVAGAIAIGVRYKQAALTQHTQGFVVL